MATKNELLDEYLQTPAAKARNATNYDSKTHSFSSEDPVTGRVNSVLQPDSYTLQIKGDKAKILSNNQLMAIKSRRYHKKAPKDYTEMRYTQYRDTLYEHFAPTVSSPPSTPFTKCNISVEIQRTTASYFDVEAKYACIKPILDILQPDRPWTRKKKDKKNKQSYVEKGVSKGLGIISDDTDGEGELQGVVQSLNVSQIKGKEYMVTVKIEKVY